MKSTRNLVAAALVVATSATHAQTATQTWVNQNFVTNSALTTKLAGYPTNSALTTALSPYAKTTALASYATTASLSSYAKSTDLANYATTSSLAGYATTTALNQAMGRKVDTAALTTRLGTYATTSNLAAFAKTTDLVNYAKITALSAYATTANLSAYAKSTDLANYATTSSLSGYATNTSVNSVNTSSVSRDNALSTAIGGKADQASLNNLSTSVSSIGTRTTALEAADAKNLKLDANQQTSVPGGVLVGGGLYQADNLKLATSTPGGVVEYITSTNSNGMAISQHVVNTDTYTDIMQLSSAQVKFLGNVAIAGSLKARTTTVVPDYVFEPGYKLASLSDVEAYTQQHKHLPEVPSAAEIGQGGLDITEMNLTLLKKVEELTLHVIAQQKEIDGLKKKVEGL